MSGYQRWVIGFAIGAIVLMLTGCDALSVDRGQYESLAKDEATIETKITGWMQSALGPDLVIEVRTDPLGCDPSGWDRSRVEALVSVDDPLATRDRLVAWLVSDLGAEIVSWDEYNDGATMMIDGESYFVLPRETVWRDGNFSLFGSTGCYDE